ncbi:MAG TPA: hypothetical protein VHG08_12195 [Longimicrobium sp.]|nr:hypothetical protein [Longimicrobium sp.]
MNSRRFALLIPLALAGCATSSRVSADEGLRARLGRGREGVVVALSEPAHVAVFEVVPGKRVQLLYPSVASDPSLLPAGRTMLEPGGWPINPYRISPSRRSAPLLYMIASRHPLDEALVRDMQAAWGVLDTDEFRSHYPTRTMERLASLVVPPDQPETDWADDVIPFYSRAPGGRTVVGGEGGGNPGAADPRSGSNTSMCRSGGGDHDCLTPAQEHGQRQQGQRRPGRP